MVGIDLDSNVEPTQLSHTSASTQISEDNSRPLLDNVPALTTFIATTQDDRRDALRLISDSVAQQRQLASRAVISNPLSSVVVILLAAIIGKYLVKERSDLPLLCTTMAGVAMACLVGVRWMVGPYLAQAEAVGRWEWLGDDTLICTKFGDIVIGALVLGWDGGDQSSNKKNTRRKAKGGRGVIRGWSVLLRYRGKGEGRLLLEEAAKIVQQRGGEGLAFEEENIYSRRVLPNIFNKPFDYRDGRGYAALDSVLQNRGGFSKKNGR